MPDQRAPGKSLIGCHVDAELLDAIDHGRAGKSRSDFLREALVSYLRSIGIHVPEGLKFAPDRTGKGGRPRKAVALEVVPGVAGGKTKKQAG